MAAWILYRAAILRAHGVTFVRGPAWKLYDGEWAFLIRLVGEPGFRMLGPLVRVREMPKLTARLLARPPHYESAEAGVAYIPDGPAACLTDPWR